MGLNAYFTYTVVKGMGVPWQTALGCVFLSGVAFLLLTAGGRAPADRRRASRARCSRRSAGGIGLFIAFIGLSDAGIIVAEPGHVGRRSASSPRPTRRSPCWACW